jgi:hypothetical protein
MADKHEAVHMYFELSYCNYLVIPRSILQSMPDDWQKKFIELVEECDYRTDWRNNLGMVKSYAVKPIMIEYTGEIDDYDGREIEKEIEVPDKYMEYERGRRKWPLKPKEKKK